MNKRILVSAYFAQNIGDDLFLKVLFDRYPHITWELLTANRNYHHVFKEYKNVKLTYTYRDIKLGKYSFNLFFIINNFISRFKEYDAIINIGGSIFQQNLAWKIRLKERNYLINNLKPKKAFILGANFGPYNDEEFLERHQDIFTQYDDICFRDSYSYNLFRRYKNIRMAPDVVFNFKEKTINRQKKTVGISIINLHNRNELKEYTGSYQRKIKQIIEELIDFGYRVKLFSFCENEGDLSGILELKKEIQSKYEKQLTIVNYTGDIDLFLNEFKKCDLIIGARFHSVILAILYNQRFYPLIYSDKTSNLLRDLDIEESSCHIKDIGNLKTKHVLKAKRLDKEQRDQLFLGANKQFEKLDDFIGKENIAYQEETSSLYN